MFIKVRDTKTLVPVPMDAGTDWEVKEELSAAAADLAASSVRAASPAATTMRRLMAQRIEELSFIGDRWAILQCFRAGDAANQAMHALRKLSPRQSGNPEDRRTSVAAPPRISKYSRQLRDETKGHFSVN